MLGFINFFMNPVFPESMVNFFYGLGSAGIVLLGFIKMLLIFIGSLIITIPVFLLILFIAKLIINIKIKIENEKQNIQKAKVIDIREYRLRKEKTKSVV